jgi:hypothetical protein
MLRKRMLSLSSVVSAACVESERKSEAKAQRERQLLVWHLDPLVVPYHATPYTSEATQSINISLHEQ